MLQSFKLTESLQILYMCSFNSLPVTECSQILYMAFFNVTVPDSHRESSDLSIAFF